jgi:hypothetical protein
VSFLVLVEMFEHVDSWIDGWINGWPGRLLCDRGGISILASTQLSGRGVDQSAKLAPIGDFLPAASQTKINARKDLGTID